MKILTNIIEIGFSISLFVNAILFIPQIIQLLKTKNSKGLSLMTFFGFSIMQFFTILHAYFANDYILMAGFLLSLIFCGTVTFLIILYKQEQ